MCSLLTPTHLQGHGLWVWNLTCQEEESSQPVLNLSPRVGKSFPVSDLVRVPLFCLACVSYGHTFSLKGGDRVLHSVA